MERHRCSEQYINFLVNFSKWRLIQYVKVCIFGITDRSDIGTSKYRYINGTMDVYMCHQFYIFLFMVKLVILS